MGRARRLDHRRGREGDAHRPRARLPPRGGPDRAVLRAQLALRHPGEEGRPEEAPQAAAGGHDQGDRLAGMRLVVLPRRPRRPGAADRRPRPLHPRALPAGHARAQPPAHPRRGGGRGRAARPARHLPLRRQQRERPPSLLRHEGAARRRALLRHPGPRQPHLPAARPPPAAGHQAAAPANPPGRADLARRDRQLHAPPGGGPAARLLRRRPRALPLPRRRRARLLQPRPPPLRRARTGGGVCGRLLLPARPRPRLQGPRERLLRAEDPRQPLPWRAQLRLHRLLPRREDRPPALRAPRPRLRMLPPAGLLRAAQGRAGADRPHRLDRHARPRRPPRLHDRGARRRSTA